MSLSNEFKTAHGQLEQANAFKDNYSKSLIENILPEVMPVLLSLGENLAHILNTKLPESIMTTFVIPRRTFSALSEQKSIEHDALYKIHERVKSEIKNREFPANLLVAPAQDKSEQTQRARDERDVYKYIEAFSDQIFDIGVSIIKTHMEKHGAVFEKFGGYYIRQREDWSAVLDEVLGNQRWLQPTPLVDPNNEPK